jgi:hypothetical protein
VKNKSNLELECKALTVLKLEYFEAAKSGQFQKAQEIKLRLDLIKELVLNDLTTKLTKAA